MKYSYTTGAGIFTLSLLFALSFSSCKNGRYNTDKPIKKENKTSAKFDDIEGAIKHELAMVIDPSTGKIPEGIRELEMKQAKDILAKQLLNGPSFANPYIFEGPNNLGGRTRALAYDVRFNGGGNQIILAGGVSGGIYKSTNNGASWVRKSPLGQHFSVTSLAQDTRVGFQDTWYYTTGEASGNSAGSVGAFYSGNGVYKSTDNGETWVRLVNSNTTAIETFSTAADVIMKVIVNPLTPNGDIYIACAATLRRSQDGGTTWATVLNGTLASSGNYTDIVMTSTGRFYAGFGGTNSAGSDGVWTSTTGNSGDWTRIAGPAGTPAGWNAQNANVVAGAYGRLVLAIAPSSENLVYAMYWNSAVSNCLGTPAPEAELFLWDQNTTTWVDRTAGLPDETGCSNGNDPFAVQGGYDLVIAVKPDDPNTVFIGGTNIYRSTNGFTTTANTTRLGGYAVTGGYTQYANSHPDIHAIVFQPGSTTTMLCGNDGGIQRTTNNLAATVAWSPINTGYRTYQYYHVAVDPRVGNNKVFGGAQDNGSTRNIGGTGSNFEVALTGDGVSVGLSDVIGGQTYEYCGFQQGRIFRRNSLSGLGAATELTPTGEGNTENELFVTNFKLDNDNTQNLYYGNDNVLYRTISASTVAPGTWTNLTGISTAIPNNLDITAISTTRGTYNAATSSLFVGASYLPGVVAAANAVLYRLNDPVNAPAATIPVNITSASFPVNAYISSITVNPRNDDTVLVTFSNYGVTSVFWTGNANSATPTWLNVEGNLTLPSFRSSVIVINGNTVEYYVGTSVGLYGASINGDNAGTAAATTWAQEGPTDMGNAVVTSLALRTSDNKLVVGTHGYGMWSTTLGISLPVTLVDFNGKLEKNDVRLSWSTSAEYNTLSYEIEKSIDGITFTGLDKVAATGNSTTLKQYTYLDITATEVNYYRLRITDRDGSFKLSTVVLVKNTSAVQDINVLTNPFTNYVNVKFAKMPSQKVLLRLVDMSGKTVAVKEVYQPNTSVIRFDNFTGILNKGLYILQVETGGKRYTEKLMKQ